MVKSFYDPKIAEETKKVIAKNMLLDGENIEKIKKYTGLSEEDINNVKRLIEGEGKH